jgi:hypothetical protein
MAAAIGLLMAGIGVCPIAVIACICKGEWSIMGQLLMQLAIRYGARSYGFYLARRAVDEIIDV